MGNRMIEIEIMGSGITAIAKLLEEDAPETCEALWSALEKPLETKALHAVWQGRTLEIELPETHRTFKPDAVPMENATIYPLPGDVLWRYHPPKAIRGLLSPQCGIMIAYGPESIMRTPIGPAPSNVWAQIIENKEAFGYEASKMWFGGARTIRIRRV